MKQSKHKEFKSTSNQHTIILQEWDPSLKLLREVQAHQTSVYCLAASKDTLYSCSNDGTIKAWNLSDLSEKATIYKCEDEIWRLVYAENVLYSGDNQGNV